MWGDEGGIDLTEDEKRRVESKMAICIRWFSVRMLADIFIELSGLGLISARSLFP